MNQSPFLANLCLSWLCCLQPMAVAAGGFLIGRYGWRGALGFIMDKVGIPRREVVSHE